ncbi:MAG TPA: hypothetical protein DCG33_00460 [Prevotellaceae bacterium]|nr:hypothetical protein [Prevotellaceae bacterium]
MKKVRCPRCSNLIAFDETAYPIGRMLVFTCPDCQKSFKIKLMPKQTDQDQQPVMGTLTVVENTFHDKQTIPLYMGDNVIGRYVKGSKANAAFRTLDPSIDTTHCIVNVQEDKNGKLRFILRDAPSNTGTFYQNEILKDVDRVEMHDQTIITIGATTLIVNIPE